MGVPVQHSCGNEVLPKRNPARHRAVGRDEILLWPSLRVRPRPMLACLQTWGQGRRLSHPWVPGPQRLNWQRLRPWPSRFSVSLLHSRGARIHGGMSGAHSFLATATGTLLTPSDVSPPGTPLHRWGDRGTGRAADPRPWLFRCTASACTLQGEREHAAPHTPFQATTPLHTHWMELSDRSLQ